MFDALLGGAGSNRLESAAPLGRIGQVDDIAPTAVYLASDNSKYMTGEILTVSGGMH